MGRAVEIKNGNIIHDKSFGSINALGDLITIDTIKLDSSPMAKEITLIRGDDKLKILNREEFKIAAMAVQSYRSQLKDYECQRALLRYKKFNMGDIVIVKNKANYLDHVFGITDNEIGKIIGWDEEYGYYRVYFSDNNPFIGMREEKIDFYCGDVPDHIMNYNRTIAGTGEVEVY